MTDSAVLSKKIAVLRQKFLADLVTTTEEIGQLIGRLQPADDNKNSIPVLKGIIHLSHKMAGTSGTFGFPVLSGFARAMELHAVKLLDNSAELNQLDVQTLYEICESIKNEGANTSNQRLIIEPIWKTLKTDSYRQHNAASKTVVIVDDDEELLHLLKIQLGQYDFNVITLIDHKQLQETLSSGQIAVVVMDIVSPDDADAGVKTVTELRAKGVLTCPVVFLSVRTDLPARLSAVRAGCDGYFQKPVDLTDLAAALSRLADVVEEEPYRVVVIDDDPQEAEFNALVLEEAGIVTMTVTDPLQAVDSICALSPDVILIDAFMPGCNGFELTKVIRQDSRYLHTPIVFLSSSVMEGVWLKAMLAGGDEFLRKNITPAELIAFVLTRATRSRQLHRMLNKLSVSESHFRAVASSARDAIITTDLKGRIVTWNKGAEEIFGYSEGEIIGSAVTSLIASRDLALYQSDFEFLELSALKKGGDEFPIEISKSKWVVESSHFSTNIIRDASQRKEHEQSLQDARILAEKANRAKSEFLSAMSHELRTPLNAIMGFNQLLAVNSQEPLTETQKNCVDHIAKGSQHLLELINDVLDLAAIEAGKTRLSIENVSMDPLIEECIELLQSFEEQYEVSITLKKSCAGTVLADYTRLKQVLLNLMSNAIKYNRPGGSVSVSCETTAARMLRVSVTDTGIGINKDKEQELFQPFSRLGAETTKVEGTGIGLSISKNLIELMAGDIGVYSVEGEGSTFWIDLPQAIEADKKNESRDMESLPVSTAALKGLQL